MTRFNIMKLKKLSTLSSLTVIALALAAGVFTQDTQPQDVQRPNANQPQDVRGNALRQLGLSREQFQQIRRLNADRKPAMDDAQKRLRLANRALDEAIYADQVNETEMQARLKELQLAQAEVAKIRFTHEFAVRRILTSDQLSRFRELRQRFEQARQALDRRQGNADRPLDRPAQNNNPNRPAANNNAAPFQPKPQPVRQDRRKPDF